MDWERYVTGRKPKPKEEVIKVTGGVGCFGDVGTGKSLVAVSLIQNLDMKLTLLLTKRAVVTTHVWEEEFERHATKPVQIVVLDPNTTLDHRCGVLRDALRLRGDLPLVVIGTWSICSDPHATALRSLILKTGWNLFVQDEGHANKGATSKTSRFCYRLAQRSERQLELTATPTPNNPLEAFGQYRTLDTRIFGTSYTAFKNKVCEFGGYQNKEVQKYKNQEWQSEQMFRIAHLVDKSVLKLPPLMYTYRYFDLPPNVEKLYDSMWEDMYAKFVGGQTTAGNTLVKMLRLQQLTSGFLRTDDEMVGSTWDNDIAIVPGHIQAIHQAREDTLKDILEDINPSMPVVIFARFQEDLKAIQRVCTSLGRTCAELSGRKDQANEWKQGAFTDIAVQVQAGGAGISLTRASYAIFYSCDFSRLNKIQCEGRVHRPGQTRSTQYIYILARGTIDEDIQDSMKAKGKVVDFLLDRLKARRDRYEASGYGVASS